MSLGRRTYSFRERFLFACCVPILGAVTVFMGYMIVTIPETRRDFLFWVALLGTLGATGVCLKIATTGTATRRLEQDAFDALAGRPLDEGEQPRPGSRAV
jgi:hypothetical protein